MAKLPKRWTWDEIQALPEVSRFSYDRALEVVAECRRRGRSLTAACEYVGVDPRTVLKYAGRAFAKSESGEWIVKPWDRLVRPMRFIVGDKLIVLPVQDSRSASKLSAYWKAVRDFLVYLDPEELRPFEHESIQVHGKIYEFVTSPRILKRMGNAGQVSFEDLYPITV